MQLTRKFEQNKEKQQRKMATFSYRLKNSIQDIKKPQDKMSACKHPSHLRADFKSHHNGTATLGSVLKSEIKLCERLEST